MVVGSRERGGGMAIQFGGCQSIGATGSAPMITAAANVSRWTPSGFAALQEMLGKREGRRDEDEPEPDRG
ncbi:hypothetical protein B9Z19DRAFT_1096377 [Tuber borchii]|uniref:Uncharacterized protein n=1 Tax=Tuber borchii TaxID=42251 RepID=A0A2T6ZBK5_TUBBO|nr:hypothetical protein B9Z19DRAFT_1096377 [Tuber borchii]